MAINFPDTPAEGDVHVVGTRSWTWDGVAWTSNTSRDYINTVSETEPSNPAPGDTWFKSSTGQTFLYYDSYWIETGVAGPAGPAGADGADGADGSDASLTRSIRNVSANTTLLADDANQMVRFTGTDQQVLTIPDVLTPGQSVHVVQDNTGQIEFASGSGVTLLSDSGEFGSSGQNTRVDIVCVADGEYRLYGDLVAVVGSEFNVEYLVIAGGGGGGFVATSGGPGGGGGAGGYRSSVSGESSGGGASAESDITVSSRTNYTVTVGAGGASVSGDEQGNSGSNSEFSSIISIGGGGGGYGDDDLGNLASGLSGGSGGGGGESSGSGVGGSGTAGQGFDGQTGSEDNNFSGGGGGAGEPGGADGNGRGGDGVESSITGTAIFRAGGGDGGTTSGAIDSNVLGGGGASGENGLVNSGAGGGGGGGNYGQSSSGSGGSGIVILRYPSDYTITIGAGLTGSTATVGANKVTTITAGTGNISFS